jgi:uncharacterized protein (TIGR02246 family)
MKRVLLAGIVAVCALAANAASPPSSAREDIVKMLTEQAAAWTRGDLDAFCSVYADDVTFISPSGMTKGRQAVLDRYRKKYVDKAGMGSLTLDVQELREATATSASVIARWTLTWPDKPKAEGLTLLVLSKTHGGWHILQDASM